MAKKQSRKAKRRVPKTVLRVPDLDQAKSAVLKSEAMNQRLLAATQRQHGLSQHAVVQNPGMRSP